MVEYVRTNLCDGSFDAATNRQITTDVAAVVAAVDAPETIRDVERDDAFDRLTDRVVEWC